WWGGGVGEDGASGFCRDDEELVDADAAAVAGAAALVAALAPEQLDAGGVGDTDGEEIASFRLVGGAAGPTHAAHEALGEDAVEHGGHQIRLRAHVLQPRDGAG